MRLGLYLFELPSSLDGVCRWEQRLGHPVQILSIYQAWGSQHRDFYAGELREIHSVGKTALITWEPWELPRPGKSPEDQSLFRLRNILAGHYDDYLINWARASKLSNVPYLLRPMHEMNGNWYPWCGTVNQNQPQEYIETWRYLHGIFRAVGAINVSWVWCPYVVSFPDSPKNRISCYYPGDAYVDWIGLDGYNWGATQPWSRWQTFTELFSPAYEIVTGLTDKPLIIAEGASAESGGSKPEWIRELKDLKDFFPRIEGFVWFNIQKECAWQIDSSERALQAFKEIVRSWSTGERWRMRRGAR